MASCTGDIITRYRRGSDGKIAWQHETGRHWARGAFQFGDKIMMWAKERIGVPKRDWETRMIPVRYMSHHARTVSIIGLRKDGVKLGESANRFLPLVPTPSSHPH